MPGGTSGWRGGRRRHAHVEHDDPWLTGVVGHGIGPLHRLLHHRLVLPEVKTVPIAAKTLLNVEIPVMDFVGRRFDLNVAAGPEIDLFACRQFQHQLLDEAGDIAVGAHLTLPFADGKDFRRQFDSQILLDADLAGQPHPLPGLAAVDVPRLRRQNGTAALLHPDQTLPAGAAAPAGRRDVNPLRAKGLQQLAAGADFERLLLILVDDDSDLAARHEKIARRHDQGDEKQDDAGKKRDAEYDFKHGKIRRYNWIPEKAMKARDMSPTTIKVIPRPHRPAGMLL